METGWLIAFTVFYFVSGAVMCPIAKGLAENKGYNGIIFAIATVLFGGIGLLCACALPDRNKKNETAEAVDRLCEKVADLSDKLEDIAKKIAEQKVAPPPPKVEAPAPPPQPVRREPPPRVVPPKQIKANLIFKDGKLVCSNCGERIGFKDATCKSCGATIVPANDSEGGFFLKK